MAGFPEPEPKRWFSRNAVNVLLSAQSPDPSEVTRTMVAAYKQRDHIAYLLALLDKKKVKLGDEEQEKVAKIRKTHEKYLIEGK